MKRVFSFCLVLVVVLGMPFFTNAAPDDWTELSEVEDVMPMSSAGTLGGGCAATILMECATGKVLFESNADEKLPIASVTKVMTLLLVAEALDSGQISKEDMVTVSENAASKGGSQIYLEVGERMSVHELLKAVVVASANDGAVALGEFVAGSEELFVAQMNARAKVLGLEVSFVNPTGLDDEACHTLSARDVAIISRELLSHSWIREYSTIWMDSVRGGAFGLTNTNRLVRFYEGTTGLKTGSTSKAKYCISASAERGGMELIAVVLGGESSDRRFSAAKELFDYGFANYAIYQPVGADFEPIRVFGGKQMSVTPSLRAEGILVQKSQVTRITEEVRLPQTLMAPVEEGQTVGEIVYCLDGKEVVRHPVLATGDVERVDFVFLFFRLLSRAFLGSA